MEEALQIQRESEIITLTGWDFNQYDRQPAGRLARMMAYISIKNAVEREKAELNSGRGRVTTGGGRH